MTMKVEGLAREFDGQGFTQQATKLRALNEEFRTQGVPESFAKAIKLTSKSEAIGVPDLGQVVSRQVDRYVGLKFHEELGMREDEYRQSLALPEGVIQPETYRGRFDVLLVVEPRISLARQHRLAGISEYIATDKIVNLTETPNNPYAVWTHDGQIYHPITVERARNQFKDDEIGSPQLEVTGLYLQHPEYFKGRGIDAAGSQFEGGDAPCLFLFCGGPGVGARWVDGRSRDWGALSRGKEIIKLGA